MALGQHLGADQQGRAGRMNIGVKLVQGFLAPGTVAVDTE